MKWYYRDTGDGYELMSPADRFVGFVRQCDERDIKQIVALLNEALAARNVANKLT